MIIFDGETIRDIEMGKREVSCGYNPEYSQLLTPDGEPIQGEGEQENIIYNHLALVENGRCGAKCAIQDHKTIDTAGLISPEEVAAEMQRMKATAFWAERHARRLERLSNYF